METLPVHKARRSVFVVAPLLVAACAGLVDSRPARADITWDMASLDQVVQPMQHSLNGFMSIRPASLPLPINDGAVTLRNNGMLRQYIDDLWARGIAVTVNIGVGTDTDAGAIATALTLQEAGIPIHVWSRVYVGPERAAVAFWPTNATPNPWFTNMYGTQWPAYPLATPTAGHDFVKAKLQTLRNNSPSISSISGLWMDYEDYPVYWADMKASIAQRTYASQYYTDAYAAGNGVLPSSYPSDLLTNDAYDSQNPMWRYSYDLQYALLKQSARQALTDVYGTTPVFGNFGAYYSSTTMPYIDGNGSGPFPPSPPGEAGIAAMPVAYANNFYLANDFTARNPSNVPVNQTTVDAVYWFRMLTAISSSQANNGSIGRSIPWVSYNVADNQAQPWVNWAMMTSPVYKELLRHLWLRGASGMYVFNRDPYYQPAQQSFNELEYARSVLDEMLSFRGFLTNGAPMNYAVNSALFSGAVEWSGLSNNAANPTQWLVRTVSRTGSSGTVASITPKPGLTFSNIPAPIDGATYLLKAAGTLQRVDSRPATVYLQFENNYQDSSGNNLSAVPAHYPPAMPAPSMTTNVPSSSGVVSVLNGAYGLYANQHNLYSLSVSRDPGSYWAGNDVGIANANAVFNAASFTVETFIKVASGMPQDSASIISKGLGPAPGSTDWAIQFRDYAGAGMLELTFVKDSTTYAYIRTAGNPLTPDVWHHLALTYNGISRQAIVYVDGVAQTLGNHNDQISDAGVLNWDFVRHSGDQVVLGYYDRGINASYDEFRFTPEVLDPLQMLTNAALQ